MAVIPEFERRRLASSVVGTPGVDESGQQAANAVARSANQVASVFGDIAVQRQQAKDAAYYNKTAIDADIAAADITQKHQEEYAQFRGDKMERVNALRTKLDALFKTQAENITSRGARDLFDKHAPSIMKSYLDNEIKTADLNQGVLAYGDTVASANTLAHRAAQIGQDQTTDFYGKQLQIESLIKRGNATYEASANVLSPEERAKLKTGIPEMISKGFLLASMDRNPEHVVEMLDSGKFDKYLSAEEKTKLKKDARAAVPKVQETREIDTLLDNIKTHQDSWDGYLAKDPATLGKLEQSNDEYSKALKDLWVKGDPDPVTQANTVMKLQAKFDSMTVGKGSNKQINKKTKLEDLQSFMTEVVDARKNGYISTDVANSYLKKIAEPMYKQIEVDHKGGASASPLNPLLGSISPAYVLYHAGVATLNNWFNKNKTQDVEKKAEAVLRYLQRFDSAKVKNAAEASALSRSVIRESAQMDNPGLGLVSGTPNKILNADTSQIFIQDGDSDVKDRVKIPVVNSNVVFKPGEERMKGDVLYVRDEKGQWHPKNKQS